MLSTLSAFFIRDLNIEKTYRFNLAVKLFAVASQVVIFFFLSRYLGRPAYFEFVLIGILFSRFFSFSITVLSEVVRQEQYWGTLESLFLYPGNALNLAACACASKSLFMFAEFFAVLLGVLAVFGLNLFANLVYFLPVLAVSGVFFFGLGLLSAGFVVYFKRGDPVNWVLTTAVDLLSGVYFSIAVMPFPLQHISKYLPTTVLLDYWRLSLIQGKLPAVLELLVILLVSAAVFAAGAVVFKAAVRASKAKGNLGNY